MPSSNRVWVNNIWLCQVIRHAIVGVCLHVGRCLGQGHSAWASMLVGCIGHANRTGPVTVCPVITDGYRMLLDCVRVTVARLLGMLCGPGLLHD